MKSPKRTLCAIAAFVAVPGCVNSQSPDRVEQQITDNDISFLEAGRSPPRALTDEALRDLSEGNGRNAKAAAAHGLLALQYENKIGTGEGLIIGVWDGGGVLETHQEFSPSRAVNGPDIDRVHWHATHVAGTLVAKGAEDFDEARGMVPDASVLAMNYCGDIRQEIESAYDRFDNLAVTNHSYEQQFRWGQYTSLANRLDDLVYDRPEAVLVVAAGNSGCSPEAELECTTPDRDGRTYGTITPPGTAKNVVSVGSMSDLQYGLEVENVHLLRFNPVLGDIPIEHYSGAGPTRDGRIKPDVVANGDHLYSTYTEHPTENACNRPATFPEPFACSSVSADGDESQKCYKEDSGTSMATPTVSGIVTALQGIALKDNSLNRLMSAVEVRALLIHTAVSVDSKPKYKYGWGPVSTKHAIEHLSSWANTAGTDSQFHYVSLPEAPERSSWRLRRIKNQRGKPLPARVTLAWNDRPGPKLVYDLNMEMRAASNGETVLPWTLNPTDPIAEATRGLNTVDNIERIDLMEDELTDEDIELTVVNPTRFSFDAVLLLSGFEVLEE